MNRPQNIRAINDHKQMYMIWHDDKCIDPYIKTLR